MNLNHIFLRQSTNQLPTLRITPLINIKYHLRVNRLYTPVVRIEHGICISTSISLLSSVFLVYLYLQNNKKVCIICLKMFGLYEGIVCQLRPPTK